MQVALLTVGDEVLAGETTNTNASWLAEELTGRGVTVTRVLTVPDDEAVIAEWVREFSEQFDAVVVTGGIGGTHDDVTVEAVARAFDRPMVVREDQRERLVRRAEAFREEKPALAEDYEFDVDLDAVASLPEGARALVTDESWAPGCVVANVYVLPGIPDEMESMFDLVADEFAGDRTSETVYTPRPEGALGGALGEVRDRFGVAVGSYPAPVDEPGRIRVSGSDPDAVAGAVAWLRDTVETCDPPE
ncbi:competence/damage-inducible protein A [Haloarchaeobius iranensis]|uniref:Molybdenum cofactor synthesis domain-containing protein n=1 Tax=Haloarchaeobius iranensis TaxID=996166 RepID=A0A1G9ZRN3_9EURY|nr:competence/damage-inducible protein A [Haloarchaeobius iranensis]SDN23814.1 molybdenum cofactor synthesis domain-containing protein [Haloarchaeobius iranensis]